MRRIKFALTMATPLLLFCACEDEPDLGNTGLHQYTESALADNHKHLEATISAEGKFIIPDSIDSSLLVVSFYENCPQQGHSIIVYTDTSKKTAKKIKYLADHSIIVDKLNCLSYNHFKSFDLSGEYLIREKTVFYANVKGCNAITFEHERTDNNLAANKSIWKLPLPILENEKLNK